MTNRTSWKSKPKKGSIY